MNFGLLAGTLFMPLLTEEEITWPCYSCTVKTRGYGVKRHIL